MSNYIVSPETFILYSLAGFTVATLMIVAAGFFAVRLGKNKQSKK
ncbi:hypothetical protein [Shewanella morhuae]|uniref:Uncharacterized protein n=1 Tax=Shewanella morhuae TaxID=365591 RepID=A0A380BUX7_9GAMM|nr:hypothetical protein [Shewanella morhuae]SUJ07596.1 Uncharacterised protein [Shewanella morhuae]